MMKSPEISNSVVVVLMALAIFPGALFSEEVAEYSAQLKATLNTALILKGSDYKPRTEHILSNGRPKYTNRLILEDSPYLIQHAHNPVNWFPWGKEAFAKAKQEGKPIFLSIGYSTCHWCHVMERESFDNSEIAKILNRHFVSIKVDRERRPDVDNTYMKAVMMITGRGGWPMSSFLTADGKTFFGGTYFPREQFGPLLKNIATAWRDQRGELLTMADKVAAAVAETNPAGGSGTRFDVALIDDALGEIMQRYDASYGGFGQAPKFPNEAMLFLLVRGVEKGATQNIANALNTTLTQMARGGIYDQIGGGFHRYSTGRDWLIPHFEKMLYNQAHLARIYTQAYRLTGERFYRRVARHTLDYVLREMTAPDGAFYSATDADSEAEEGRFFVWTPKQISTVLGADDAAKIIKLYGVSEAGNFEGRNILHLPEGFHAFSAKQGIPLRQFLSFADEADKKLRREREKRIHPLRDDKIVTAWNGMMVSSLAIAGEVLTEQRYVDAAIGAANFILKHNLDEAGELLRVNLRGNASIPAAQEDYAYFVQALLALYDVTGDTDWLNRAENLSKKMIAGFWDNSVGGFFMNRSKGRLMARPKDSHDGAIPSGNSVAVSVLARLSRRSPDILYRGKAAKTLAAFSDQIARSPGSFGYMLTGADDLFNGEQGSRQYAAYGAVSVIGRTTRLADQRLRLVVDLSIKPGWHINSNKPLDQDLIPTMLQLAEGAKKGRLTNLEYPKAILKSLGFQREILALYEGKIRLAAIIEEHNSDTVIIPLELRLQACNDEACLAPEILNLPVSTASG